MAQTDPNNVELVGLSFSYKPGTGYYIPCPKDLQITAKILEQFKPLFDDTNKIWVGQNIKYDLIVMKWYGVELKGEIFDTMLAHYLIEPEGRRSMDLLSAQFLQYEPIHIEELIGKKGKNQGNMRDVEVEKIKEYAAEDADITLQLKNVFVPLLKEKEVEKVFNEVENPLVQVLTEMEYEGVKIDVDFLKDYSIQLDMEAKAAEQRVFDCCGLKFNLGSPKQLGEVLFDHLKLDPKAKKTKSGQYATGEDVLAKLANQHAVANDILIFRELSKLKSTYVDALPSMINPKTGRVHTCYSQAVAVTGRLSSNNPNLQNIPIRTEKGKEIRKAFIPRDENHVLLSADYSQIELRLIAEISGDEGLRQAFIQKQDIHAASQKAEVRIMKLVNGCANSDDHDRNPAQIRGCLLLAAHRRFDPSRRFDKALVPEFKHEQGPEQLTMIGHAALVFILQFRYIFRIENAGLAHAIRRQEIARQRLQFSFQPLRHRNAKTFLAAADDEGRQ